MKKYQFMKKVFLFCVVLILVSVSCKKNEELIPQSPLSDFAISVVSDIEGAEISWTESTSGTLDVAYDLYLNDNLISEDITVLSYSLAELSPSTDYNVKVIAKAADLENSSTKKFTTLDPASPSLFEISLKEISYKSINISWTASTIADGTDITYGIDVNGTTIATDLTETNYLLDNLIAATSYEIKITAISEENGTTSEAYVSGITLDLSKPSDIEINYTSAYTAVELNWTASTITGDDGVYYQVWIDGTLYQDNIAETSLALSDLQTGTSYEVVVVAISNEFNTKTETGIVLKTEEAPVPEEFELTLEVLGSGSIKANWGSLIIEDGSSVVADVYINEILETEGCTENSCIFTELEASTEYTIKVVARSVAYLSIRSIEGVVTTLDLASPSLFEISLKDISHESMNISWTSSTITDGTDITYNVDVNGSTIATDLTETNYLLDNLIAATNYEIKVTAISEDNGTTSEVSVSGRTLDLSKPSEVEITYTSAYTTIDLNWSKSTITGSEGVYYQVLIDGVLHKDNITGTSLILSDLYTGTSYEIVVVAISNEFNTKTETNIVLKTEDAPVPDEFELTLEVLGSGSIKATWSSLTMGDDHRVSADVYINGRLEADGWTAGGYVFTGLETSTEYTIKVVARSYLYSSTREVEKSVTTDGLPTSFKVETATVYPRTTGTFGHSPMIIIKFNNRDLFESQIDLNGQEYKNFLYAGDNGITFSITDEEYAALSALSTKEGVAYFKENDLLQTATFTYNLD